MTFLSHINQAVSLLLLVASLYCTTGQEHNHHDIDYGKNHLHGIRQLQWQPRYTNRDQRKIIDQSYETELHSSTIIIPDNTEVLKISHQIIKAPTAVAPTNVIINYHNLNTNKSSTLEKHTNYISRQLSNTNLILTSTLPFPERPSVNKWRKIGPLIDARGSPFQRMRLIHQHRLSNFGINKVAPYEQYSTLPKSVSAARHNDTENNKIAHTSLYYKPTVVRAKPLTDGQQRILHNPLSSEESVFVDNAHNNVDHYKNDSERRLSSDTHRQEPKSSKLSKNVRRYRPQIHGQILSTVEHPNLSDNKLQLNKSTINMEDRNKNINELLMYESSHYNSTPFAVPHFNEDNVDDYHHRKGMQVEKRFKLAPNKVGYRPRLKIRRPNDISTATITASRAAGDENLNAFVPIHLPHLATLRSTSSSKNEYENYLSSTTDVIPHLTGGDLSSHQSSRKMFIIEEPVPTTIYKVAVPAQKFDDNSEARTHLRSTSSENHQQLHEQEIKEHILLKQSSLSPLGNIKTTTPSVDFINGEERGSVGEQPPQPSSQRESSLTPKPYIPFNNNDEKQIAVDSAESSGLAYDELHLPSYLKPEVLELAPHNDNTFNIDRKTINEEPETTTTIGIIEASSISTTALEEFVIPENSGLRPVAPPKELGGVGFGSNNGIRNGGFGGGSGAFGNSLPSSLLGSKQNIQVEAPREEDFFTGDSALMPNHRGPTGDGYGPPVLQGAAVPPLAPIGPVSYGGAAAGIAPIQTTQLMPLSKLESTNNEATTVRPSALLNILNKADEGFNQVISHFEQGTPIEAAAIDVLEVALGSQKLDSQAKLLSHVDRTIGLDNIQRLQRWANTGGALDMLKEQFAKMAKNYKPPPETRAITIPPQLEYLFQSGNG